MRSLVAVAFVALLLPLVPTAAGQSPPVALLEDKSGDIQVIVADAPAGNPASRFASDDLVGLEVEEAQDSFTFRLKVASLSGGPEAPGLESSFYGIGFAHQAMSYRLVLWRNVNQATTYGGQFEVYDAGRGDYDGGQSLAVTVDAPNGVLAATVPRDLLLDEMGAAPFPGRQLTQFFVTANSIATDGLQFCFVVVPCTTAPMVGVEDRMPDNGFGPLPFDVQMGLAQTGYARLASDTPVRASNGEATTFVFQVNASNLDDTAHRFALSAVGAPGSWQVNLPSQVVEVPAASEAVLPVLVTTPFGHNHGTFQSFTLEMASLDDAGSVGRVDLGVRYTATPQPAGHHNQLYLHSAAFEDFSGITGALGTVFGFDPHSLYFNTLAPEDDENDQKTPVGGSNTGGFSFDPASPGLPTSTYSWNVPLSPQLAMGLDFDLAAVGNLRVSVDSVLPLPGAQLGGRLVHTVLSEPCDPSQPAGCQYEPDDFDFGEGKRTTVATLQPVAAVEIGANTVGKGVEATVTPTPEGDYVPFQPGTALTLQINLTFARPDVPFGPHDLPKISGGLFTLPLLEYHDPVDQVFASTAGLMIEVQGSQQRLANAGETAVFDLNLMNHGGDAAYHLELTGTHADWATILGDEHVAVSSGQARPLAIAVRIPADAAQDAAADLVLAAVHSTDPNQRTLVRLVVTVDESADHADDSARAGDLDAQLTSKQAPTPGALPLLALLGLLAATLRRRTI